MFQRILIANRGEIALRVIRACREMGIETVAVYSQADKNAHYLSLADETYCIGKPAATDSYLLIDRIISAAEIGNVQAIHPGYGFLAENAHFAEVCRECNIEFIGPDHRSMEQVGDKVSAREIAINAKVNVVPGSDGLVDDEATALKVAGEIGYPVIIKATAGGGGKGMRVAMNDISLKSGFAAARTEAEKSFNNPGVYLEKFIEHPRHIEVQVLADKQGNAFHLWERDCSTQRKHQKLIEESPAPNLPKSVREDICKSAVRLIKSVKYYNAGTVEFILDRDHQFYFIEVNARIQVEHPVSEMVTGIDLIKEQIRVAAGEELKLKQRHIKVAGCAMEIRINAEDPDNDFRGCPGRITKLRVPGGLGIRFDSHVHEGYQISPYYDSMIGKLIVHRPTRKEAIAAAYAALGEFEIEGVKTTIPLAQKILSHSVFVEGKMETTFLEQNF